jgi:Asp-tRNA(Asn)/Glu-tRNA(Gln) amidotransferase A subunit family amidase
MPITDDSRRRFLCCFAGTGLSATLLPGVLLGQVQQSGADAITEDMLKAALALAGLACSDEDQKAILRTVNQNLPKFEEVRNLHIPNDVAPPSYFSAIVPGMKVNRTRAPLHFSAPRVRRPANLEDAAFWSVSQLAQLIRTRQVTSVELTKMYLGRLHKYNERLNCVVTFLDDLALEQAKQADAEIAAGRYKGPLHGIPWGAKDIIAVKGYKTTWGSDAYKDQVIDEDATVVELLRSAGAVLLAKLASGELAQGDQWFGGQTKNPWNPAEGSSGSSAGPASATGGGLVAFALGTETSGSILSPAARCGVTGLRPTFGRVSRFGVMTLSWSQDRLGPMCRYAEDCALVMSVIARQDDRDLSVSDVPFNYNSLLDLRKLRVGYVEGAIEEMRDPVQKKNAEKVLEQLQALDLKLVPVKIPEWTVDVSAYPLEGAVFFDELVRSGRDHELTSKTRGNTFRAARTVPAVEYLQSQRARTMMMMQLAEATADVDVYIAPANGGGGRPAPALPTAPQVEARPPRVQGPAQRHSTMANLACYPAIAVPNGFSEAGTPTSITFFARPFGEAELLAVAKAYQDASGFHLKHPSLSSAA